MKIGILGYGNMGAAMAERLKTKYQVFVFDKDPDKTKDASGLTVVKSIEELVNSSNAIIMAVKPQDFETALAEIKRSGSSHLVISIAAGITTSYIEARLGKRAVIRVMPNLPAKVGAGMICLTRGKYTTEIDLSFAQSLFNRMGVTMSVEENMMNAVTGVSGSGPGFLYDLLNNLPRSEWDKFIREEFIPKLAYVAGQVGFNPREAAILAKNTAEGSMTLLRESKLTAVILRVRVTSHKGTTEAGLAMLQGKIANLEAAVKAAIRRSEELSSK